MKEWRFNHIVAAGSWDHFHLGHERFLNKAFELAQKVSVGITNDKMSANKPFLASLQPYRIRRLAVEKFLKKKRLQQRSTLVKLNDIYGPALTDRTLEGVLITSKTLAGGKLVNKKRKEMGLSPLQLIKVDLARASDGGEISSGRIRNGEINRQGLVYLNQFKRVNQLLLPQKLRPQLKRPFGKLLLGSGKSVLVKLKVEFKRLKPPFMIGVGDVVTQLVLAGGVKADLFVVDFRIERRQRFKSLKDLGFPLLQKFVKVENPAGAIAGKLMEQIEQILRQLRQKRAAPVIVVEGEEDLAVLPVVLAAPLNSIVLYGQPHQGVVLVEVTEEKKQEAFKLLNQFRKVDRV